MFSFIVLLVTLLLTDRVCSLFTPLGNKPWNPRQRHASWTDGASIFIAGGQEASGGTTNTVWTSGDGGNTWGILPSVSYRMGMAGVSFQGTQYVVGGRSAPACVDSNDVGTWNPSGLWIWSTAPWSGRSFAMTAVWNPPPATGLSSQLLVIGGARCGSLGYLNDVWSLKPGSGWSPLGLAPFPPVASAGVATIQQESQVILAGGASSDASPTSVYNTVWVGAFDSATSQLAWSLRCSAAPWSARTVSLAATSDDYLYMIHGPQHVDFFPTSASNDVWSSPDGGYSWVQLVAADAFTSRVGATLVAVNRQLVLVGGAQITLGLPTYYNDVWQAWLE